MGKYLHRFEDIYASTLRRHDVFIDPGSGEEVIVLGIEPGYFTSIVKFVPVDLLRYSTVKDIRRMELGMSETVSVRVEDEVRIMLKRDGYAETITTRDEDMFSGLMDMWKSGEIEVNGIVRTDSRRHDEWCHDEWCHGLS